MIRKMMAEEPGVKRQAVVDSIATKILPLQSAFGELLKEMIDSGIVKTGTKNEQRENTA